MGAPTTNRAARIPTTLQSVFLASNRGNEVHKPPPENVAFKVFFRNWFFQRGGNKSTDDEAKPKRGFFQGRRGKNVKKENKDRNVMPQAPVTPAGALRKRRGARPNSPRGSPTAASTLSPQGYLDAMIRSRGYSTRRFKTLQTAYYNQPTALQQASYHVYLIELMKSGDADKVEAILKSGISANPCNSFGESLLHNICRRGDHDMLKIMLDNGCNVQVADDYGRTPLHDACWAATPCFEVVELLLKIDHRLFHMTDTRGAVPLSYVRKDHWSDWINFLDSKKDVIWTPRNLALEGEEQPPPLTLEGANTKPLADPADPLTVELAGMVASGKMNPEEAEFLKYDRTDETVDSDDDDDSGSECDDDSDYESDSDFSMDDDEMADLLNGLSLPVHAQ